MDIGGTFIKHGVLEADGTILCKDKCATEAKKGGSAIREKVLQLIKNYLSDYQAEGVCISTAGVVDIEKGEILYSSELIPDYKGINYKSWIEEKFHLPCEVENDVNCMGLAESIFGAGQDSHINLCLTVGTGIGGAFVVERHVFRGYSGSACEVGFIQLKEGRFQELASTRILCEKVKKRKGDFSGDWDGYRIFQEVYKKDPICCEEVEKQIAILAEGIANLCFILNPQTVILGGGIMEQEEYIRPRLEKKLKEYLPNHILKNTKIRMAACRNDAGLVGALLHFQLRQERKEAEKENGKGEEKCSRLK